MENYEIVGNYDVLVIGSGGAGLRASIAAKEKGVSVCVVSKSLLGKAHTVMAEGGIAASFGNVEPQDSWECHFRDTMKSGAYINNWRLVEKFVKKIPERILELERWGALFDRTPAGKIQQRAFGGHTYKRVCHIGDRTGLEILRTLQDRAVELGVDVLQDVVITKLLKSKSGALAGVFGYQNNTGKFVLLHTKSVILATGGYGRIYKVTSNSCESTGDGMSMAYNIGAELADMEMVQFHPTGMAYPESARGILVTEAVRGEGGVLLNIKGERFMKKYDPEKMELSTRDKVSRAIYQEIIDGRGTEHEAVYLDISHKNPEFIKTKLPSMYHQFLDLADVDITRQKMEVAPTAHYAMGGVRIAPETCETTIKGLYACGEVSNGLHGANRMGGNSVAELIVFGKIAGESSADYASHLADFPNIEQKEAEEENRNLLKPFERKSGENPFAILLELQETMQSNAGLVRAENGLKTALSKILELKDRASSVTATGSRVFNPGWDMAITIPQMLLVAESVVRCAIERKESRGAHTRSDYPGKNRELSYENMFVVKDVSGMKVMRRPVPEIPGHLAELLPKERE